MVLLFPLGAREYRIGLVISGENEGVSALLRDVLSFSSSTILNEELSLSNENRLISDFNEEEEKKKGEAIRSEKEFKKGVFVLDDTPLKGKIVDLALDDASLAFILNGDEDALSYFKAKENLDEILIAVVEKDEYLTELTLNREGEEIAFLLFSSILDDLDKSLLDVFLPIYRAEDTFALALATPDVSVSENEAPVERYGDYLVLTKGEHELEFYAKGFEKSASVITVVDGKEEIEVSLIPETGFDLYISTRPYTDKLILNGRKLEKGYAENVLLPFTLTASKDGYVPRTVQSSLERDIIELQLLPVSLYDPDRLLEEKSSFYGHLLGTLISFGLSVASESMDRMLPDVDLSLMSAGLYGLTATGVVMMIDSLFDYKTALLRSY